MEAYTTDRPALARRLASAAKELSDLAAMVDVAMLSGDGATVTLISAKPLPAKTHRPIAPLSQARAMAARARMWPILKRVRGL